MLDAIKARVNRWYHKREVEEILELYRQSMGRQADKKQAYADSGPFSTQVHRLFQLASAAETGVCRDLAHAVVTSCLSNKFYRPADFLSDIITALESQTWLSGEPEGEPPIGELDDHRRAFKLDEVRKAWLVPLKVASIETVTASHAKIVGRTLPYAALARFERQTARCFALLDQSEVVAMENRLLELLEGWKSDEGFRQRFPEPAQALARLVAYQEGRIVPDETDGLRVRGPRQPIRLTTLVPEARGNLLKAALASLGLQQPEQQLKPSIPPRLRHDRQDQQTPTS